jgi:hypothetical protein
MKYRISYQSHPSRSSFSAGCLRKALVCLAGALPFLLAGAGASAQSRFEEEFDDQDKPWQEIAVQLPAAPTPENLLPFDVSATATHVFAVDGKSIAVGTDGVVRYTLVSKSEGGATNVSYEGIRCETYERKMYAFGREDGSWSRARRDKWERITGSAANRQHAALAKDYFCQQKTIAGNAKDMVRRLKTRQPLNGETYN